MEGAEAKDGSAAASTATSTEEAELRKVIEETQHKFKDLVAAADWAFVKEDRGVRISCRSDSSGLNFMRGDMTFDCTVEEFHAFILQVERRPEWDPLLTSSKLVRKISDLMIVHLVFMGQWPVYPRDLCIVAGTNTAEDGSFSIVGRSVVDPACPEISGNVRADLHVSGFLVVPRKEGKGVDVTYTAQIDLKGWLPAWVGNLVAEEAPMSLMKMHKLIVADRKSKQDEETKAEGQAEDASS